MLEGGVLQRMTVVLMHDRCDYWRRSLCIHSV